MIAGVADTHTAIWHLFDDPRLSQAARKFIDDAAAAKLLRAAREHPDPFTRLAVEFLARTGLRKGEFLDLTTESVVQIGSAYWLHVPGVRGDETPRDPYPGPGGCPVWRRT